MKEYLDIVSESLSTQTLVKLTLSKPRSKSQDVRNIYLRPVILRDDYMIQVIERTKTQAFTKNILPSEVINYVKGQLTNYFFLSDLMTKNENVHLLQSKKGKIKTIRKKAQNQLLELNHDKSKNRRLDINAAFLKDLDIVSDSNKVYAHAQDKFKQIDKYIDILDPIIRDEIPMHTYDMGCGKGYLTFALYEYLQKINKDVKVYGVEIREDLISKSNQIAQQHKMDHLHFDLGSIDTYPISKADMVVALHACDIATDMAIAKGIKAEAQYIIVAPCCHKQIRNEIKKIHSSLSPVLKHGILLERQAEMITDGIRALILESNGYETKVFEFISSEHTGKNIMIAATYTGNKNAQALEEINQIKRDFNIEQHYLESLL